MEDDLEVFLHSSCNFWGIFSLDVCVCVCVCVQGDGIVSHKHKLYRCSGWSGGNFSCFQFSLFSEVVFQKNMAITYSALATDIDKYEMIIIVNKSHQHHTEGAIVIHEFGPTLRRA